MAMFLRPSVEEKYIARLTELQKSREYWKKCIKMSCMYIGRTLICSLQQIILSIKEEKVTKRNENYSISI